MAVNEPDAKPKLTAQVAEEIRALLARRRMSGRELARQIGASHSWMNFRLTGSQPIDLNDLQRIADALGVEASDLLPRPGRVVVTAGHRESGTTQPYVAQPKRPHPFGRELRPPNIRSARRPATKVQART